MQKYTIIFDGNNGTATIAGIDQPVAKVVQHYYSKTPEGEYGTIVLKVPGHTYWSGRNMPRSYAAAEYQVYQITHSTETDAKAILQRIEAVRICDFLVKQ